MLWLMRDVENMMSNRRVVELAIFFHDVIYNPRSASNEEDSAALFQRFANEVQLEAKDAAAVVRFILSTKSHTSALPEDNDERLFLDLDMAILGAPEKEYERYADGIRFEYAFVVDYPEKRIKVLEKFLQAPHLYHSQVGVCRFSVSEHPTACDV